MSILDSIRRWIDGEVSDDPLADVDDQARPRRVWEDFLVRVAREVEAVMQREMFTPPGGPTYIPPEYVVYLSNEDDKDWQGEKRRGLEQGLYYVLSERARELSGQTQLATKSFAVELRVDGTLNRGEFRVQPVWESNEQSGHTMVTPKPSLAPDAAPADGAAAAGEEESPEGEVTKVSIRPVELFSVEIWKGGVRQSVTPVLKPDVTIGRGSKSVAVDLPIKGDPEVSRLHATLERDDQGRFWFTPKGRNPTFVAGREIPREERVQVQPDEKIEIASFTLRIQPK
ncbi:MAG: FHA domain-containing protein [Acidobacteriota bacterium]|nr:FHA domain-containing protein [Acidobacteriota bacterium]